MGQKGEGGGGDIFNAFPPGNPFARMHARHETISRLGGGLPKGELTPPNLRFKKLMKHTWTRCIFEIQQTMNCITRFLQIFDID